MLNSRPKTIFCDIDGTLIKHNKPHVCANENTTQVLLPNVLEKLTEWDSKGYCIVLVTGRKESMRETTEKQLRQLGIFYDQLIMGITGGVRVIINDDKPDGTKTVDAISLKRDEGIGMLNV